MVTAGTRLVAFGCMARIVLAHIAMYQPGTFGFTSDRDDLENPLNKDSGDMAQWLCRGLDRSTSGGTVELVAGGNLNVALGCTKQDAESGKTCPENPGSLHDGSSGSSSAKPEALVGCAIGIAYTAAPRSIDDFDIISVLEACVLPTSSHVFSLPTNLPAAEAGSATGSWFWIPSVIAAADEMYMSCFSASVQSNTTGRIANGIKPLLSGVPQAPTGPRPKYAQLGAGALPLQIAGENGQAGISSMPTSVRAVVVPTASAVGPSPARQIVIQQEQQERHCPSTPGALLQRRLARRLRRWTKRWAK